jgi:hypothetical protein
LPFHDDVARCVARFRLAVRAAASGSSSNEQLPSYKTAGQATFFRYVEDGDDAIADGDHYRVSPQATWSEGSPACHEYVRSSSRSRTRAHAAAGQRRMADPLFVPAHHRRRGDGGTERALRFRRQPLVPGAALRWSSLDVDGEAFRRASPTWPTADGRATAINWYLNRNVSSPLSTPIGGGDGTGDREDERIPHRMQVVL